ncbi:MAG: rfbF [Burkholderiales bacterium]|jgi:glucose-1-phosphate cytidylyltransferase|nr:rfbF [Burkholderiales bacterium]
MKCVLLAGGLGTRLSEETVIKPKPMVEIGGKPILWHIMKMYSHYGINEFIICLGYKGYVVKEYFANYFLHMSDVTFDMQNNQMEVHSNYAEPWKVTLINTGDDSMTGGRLKYAKEYVKNDEAFCFTYGDGLSNVNISKLIEFHNTQGRLATLTAVTPPGRFGALDINEQIITSFKEKPKGDGAYINGGFFVLSPKVIDLIDSDSCIWEKEPLEALAEGGQLAAYTHDEFWQPMDTLRDKHYLESLWNSNEAPWKLWK